MDQSAVQGATEGVATSISRITVVRFALLGLVASMVLLGSAHLAVPDSYSIVNHAISAAGGQGVQGAWIVRTSLLITAASVFSLISKAGRMWGYGARLWLRVYATALIFLVIFPEAPWTGAAHNATVAWLHTASGVVGTIAFSIGVFCVWSGRPDGHARRRLFDWVVITGMALIPQIMLVLPGPGLWQRAMIALGYAWLMVEGAGMAKSEDEAQILDPPRSLDARRAFLWTVGPPVLRFLWRAFFSLRVEWQGNRPAPPFVMAANHYSHFDPPVITAVLDMPIRYLGLTDLFEAHPMVTWLIEGFGTIPTPRHRPPVGAMSAALTALESGEAVGVFPEATRVSHWGVLPAKIGAAWLANQADVPLIPVAVLGTGRALGLDNKLRRAPIRVVIGEPLSPAPVDELTRSWEAWIGRQIARHPHLETDEPRRAATDTP